MTRMIIVAFVMVCGGYSFGQSAKVDQNYYEKLWKSTGVDFPEGGKFYNHKRVSQRLVTVNSIESNGIFDASYQGLNNINQQYPWVTPSGLHWSPKEQWSKIGMISLPKNGKIEVWREYTQVLNSFGSRQRQPRISWAFPTGTIFGEMLIRRFPDIEYVFEIRERIKTENGWDSGTTFRPSFDGAEKQIKKHDMIIPSGKLSDFGFGNFNLVVAYLPKQIVNNQPRLTASRLTYSADHSESIVPQKYMGNITKCNVCHSKAGESTSYGATAIPGSDSILSWQPFVLDTLNTDQYPRFDYSWPLVSK